MAMVKMTWGLTYFDKFIYGYLMGNCWTEFSSTAVIRFVRQYECTGPRLSFSLLGRVKKV